MRHVYICKFKRPLSGYEFIHIICSNERTAKKWLKKHGKPTCKKWAEEGETWEAFYYKDILYSDIPF